MVDKASLLLLLWAGVTASTVVDLHKRVIGDERCNNNERHYHVKLADDTGYACAGSLISNQWVLTAAHCSMPGRHVIVGEHPGPGPGKKVEILKEVKYWDKSNTPHDLMLLKLKDCFPDIIPVANPDCTTIPKKMQVAGYSSKTANSKGGKECSVPSPTLQCAETNIVNCDNLKKNWIKKEKSEDSYNFLAHQHWFCGQRDGVEICNGDSGGGVVSNDKIYGVISLSNPPNQVNGVVTGGDAAFMDLCNPEYATWIQETTRIYWPV